eukprot:PhM_4_TR19060/c1_g1_i1/m.15383
MTYASSLLRAFWRSRSALSTLSRRSSTATRAASSSSLTPGTAGAATLPSILTLPAAKMAQPWATVEAGSRPNDNVSTLKAALSAASTVTERQPPPMVSTFLTSHAASASTWPTSAVSCATRPSAAFSTLARVTVCMTSMSSVRASIWRRVLSTELSISFDLRHSFKRRLWAFGRESTSTLCFAATACPTSASSPASMASEPIGMLPFATISTVLSSTRRAIATDDTEAPTLSTAIGSVTFSGARWLRWRYTTAASMSSTTMTASEAKPAMRAASKKSERCSGVAVGGTDKHSLAGTSFEKDKTRFMYEATSCFGVNATSTSLKRRSSGHPEALAAVTSPSMSFLSTAHDRFGRVHSRPSASSPTRRCCTADWNDMIAGVLSLLRLLRTTLGKRCVASMAAIRHTFVPRSRPRTCTADSVFSVDIVFCISFLFGLLFSFLSIKYRNC